MKILGIDTSFDDTAASVVENTTLLSNIFSSQLPIYQQWGGVVPRLARQSHEEHIDGVITKALQRANTRIEDIDAIAVTQGPGLSITLEIGIAKAKELSAKYNKPLIAVNHMEGHLLSFLAKPMNKTKEKSTLDIPNIFPAVGILVSGKNTQFVLATKIGEYTILGQTQDDAMGEAFDKVGRMLGLGYPAGSLIEKLAKDGTPGAISFPVPMRSVKSADTSFSGLKTAAMRIIDPLKEKKGGLLTKQDICDIAYAFQEACVTHVIEKLEFALQDLAYSSLILGGGVAANTSLRTQLRKVARKHGVPFFSPYTKKLCVDNAAMIALTGYYKADRGEYVGNTDQLDRVPNLKLGQ